MLDEWVGQPAFQVLDLSPDIAPLWHELLAIWRQHPLRPRHLHWVSLRAGSTGSHVDFERHEDVALDAPVGNPANRALLTQVTGERHAALRELRMTADALLLPSFDPLTCAPWACTPWTAKLLARHCRRGTMLFAESLAETSRQALAAQGFELQPTARDAAAASAWSGQYNPRWQPKNRTLESATNAITNRRCIVIGAGLAGASTANALAARGWSMHVLDAAPAPATGASSLPVGLMVAHRSVDDNPRSRLTRAGVHMTTLQARRWLKTNVDWAPNGVLTLKPGSAAQFQAEGAWVKPQSLVEAWMAHPGVRFAGSATVAALDWHATPAGGEWRALDANGHELAAAPYVVLAAAAGCAAILQNTATLQHKAGRPSFDVPKLISVPGQVSWGFHAPGDELWTPATSVNGQGYLVANLPIDGRPAWLMGSTFEDEAEPLDTAAGHALNFSQMQMLMPGAAAALAARFETRAVNAWRSVRCTTADRLPLVGPVSRGAPGLWLNTGYGARGLTWSVLCAELLASRLGGEPWPIAASLAGKLGERRSLRG